MWWEKVILNDRRWSIAHVWIRPFGVAQVPSHGAATVYYKAKVMVDTCCYGRVVERKSVGTQRSQKILTRSSGGAALHTCHHTNRIERLRVEVKCIAAIRIGGTISKLHIGVTDSHLAARNVMALCNVFCCCPRLINRLRLTQNHGSGLGCGIGSKTNLSSGRG